jgi:hypothetical protein
MLNCKSKLSSSDVLVLLLALTQARNYLKHFMHQYFQFCEISRDDFENSSVLCAYISLLNFYDVKLVSVILPSLFAEETTREAMRG